MQCQWKDIVSGSQCPNEISLKKVSTTNPQSSASLIKLLIKHISQTHLRVPSSAKKYKCCWSDCQVRCATKTLALEHLQEEHFKGLPFDNGEVKASQACITTSNSPPLLSPPSDVSDVSPAAPASDLEVEFSSRIEISDSSFTSSSNFFSQASFDFPPLPTSLPENQITPSLAVVPGTSFVLPPLPQTQATFDIAPPSTALLENQFPFIFEFSPGSSFILPPLPETQTSFSPLRTPISVSAPTRVLRPRRVVSQPAGRTPRSEGAHGQQHKKRNKKTKSSTNSSRPLSQHKPMPSQIGPLPSAAKPAAYPIPVSKGFYE